MLPYRRGAKAVAPRGLEASIWGWPARSNSCRLFSRWRASRPARKRHRGLGVRGAL